MWKNYLLLVLITFYIHFVWSDLFKCANEDCSEPITDAKATHTHPIKNNFEINVKKGEIVYIYGIDKNEINYLVKKEAGDQKELGDFYLLPTSVLRENIAVKSKATVLVESPFHRTKLTHSSPSVKKKCSSIIERFNVIIRDISACPSKRTNPQDRFAQNNTDVEENKDVSVEEVKNNLTMNITKETRPETSETASTPNFDLRNEGTEALNIPSDPSVPAVHEPLHSANLSTSESSLLNEHPADMKVDVYSNPSDDDSTSGAFRSQSSVERNPLKSAHSSDPVPQPQKIILQPNISVGDAPTNSTMHSQGSFSSNFDLNPVNQSTKALSDRDSVKNNLSSVPAVPPKREISENRSASFETTPLNEIKAFDENSSAKTSKPLFSMFEKNTVSMKRESHIPVRAADSTDTRIKKEKWKVDAPLVANETLSSIDKDELLTETPKINVPMVPVNLAPETEKKKPLSSVLSKDEEEAIFKAPEVPMKAVESGLNIVESNPVPETFNVNISPDPQKSATLFEKEVVPAVPIAEHSKKLIDSEIITEETRIISEPALENTLEHSSPSDQVYVDPSLKRSSSASVEETTEVVASESHLTEGVKKYADDLHAGQFYDILKETSYLPEISAVEEEPTFYAKVLDYVANFSVPLENIASLRSYMNFEWLQRQKTSVEQLYCEAESCEGSIFTSVTKYGFHVDILNLKFWPFSELEQSRSTCLVTGIFFCSFLFVTTLVSIIRNFKKKNRISTLVSVVNQLERKLLVATKEISSLEEKLVNTTMFQASQPSEQVSYEVSEQLQQQIEQLQLRNIDLEDKVSYLEKELENVTTSAFEMHKLLESSLSTQANTGIAEDEVDTLRTLTERQEQQIDDLMKEMDSVITENRYLKEDLKKIEKECISQTKKNLELSEKNRNLSLRLDRQIEETATLRNNYKSEIYQLQSQIEDLEISLRRSEFQIEELNRAFVDKHENKSDDQIQALQDDVQLKMQLTTLKAMNNELSVELKEQKNARRTLDDHIGDVIRECNELKQALETSEKGRNEAVNKLQVLTDYFSEKESQLQKEIAAKEKLLLETENKDQLLSQKLSSLKDEISNSKERNEELRKEIHSQEISYKNQLATAEQKSRDLWFALRQAERKYQESEKEAATLRNRIIILETNLSSVNQKLNEKNSTNGDISGQSLMFSPELLSYRTASDFIPPPPSPIASHSPEFFIPPEPSYSPDERLPPLGGRRVPSPPSLQAPPPDDDDFKPPLPHAQYMPTRNRHEPPMPSYFADNAQYN